MSNRPLAQPDSLTRPPQESEYDALYTALAASERGRWFLAEFARRHHADTAVGAAAITHVEPASRSVHLPSAPPGASCDLVGIAAALAGIEAEIGNAAAPAPAGSAAVERLQDIAQDIAFVLHERAIEAKLCDNLGAAVREISAVFAHADPAAESLRNAAEPLRALARSLADMITQAGSADAPEPAIGLDTEGLQHAAGMPPPPPKTAGLPAPDLLAALRALSEEELIALFS
jgi:hypothetical protein